jgi:hypothetical protein
MIFQKKLVRRKKIKKRKVGRKRSPAEPVAPSNRSLISHPTGIKALTLPVITASNVFKKI